MSNSLIFDPLISWPLLWTLAAVAAVFVVFAAYKRLNGWWLRALAALVLVAALANISIQSEDRVPLSDIVIAVVDDTSSQSLSDRPDQTQVALDHIRTQIAERPNTELRVVRLDDGENDSGTALLTALSEALGQEPSGRVAGVVLITDGIAHDLGVAPPLPAPLHLLLTGQETDWDRRLIIRNAPSFAILGEQVSLTLRIEDQGKAPDASTTVPLSITIDGGQRLDFQVPIAQDIEIPLSLPHGGINVLQFETPLTQGELTDRNNSAVVQINGVRDRLRVLLVSGEPYAGERTWRNLLKSDSSVDLVHFTILRPPEKQDGVPVNEMSLIAFPTRELFMEKIDEFDLIVFDRYRRRGILPTSYIANIADYVLKGGAVLVAAGPEFGSAESIFRSPLGDILPGAPSARIFERGFVPEITELGAKHPVTEGLADLDFAPTEDGGMPTWGRWLRQIEVAAAQDAEVIMSGVDQSPLLLLDRVGEGRVALLASDQAWLWDRGFEGGGPQQELLRRLAHWMMKEPELEEEALWLEAIGETITVIRRTLGTEVPSVTVTGPDGAATEIELNQVTPGRFEARFEAPMMGLYTFEQGDKEAVIAIGPAAPKEFENTIATGDLLEPIVDAKRGGIFRIEDTLPDVRAVQSDRPAAGRGWIGITPREAYRATTVSIASLVPTWLLLLMAAGMLLGAWLREGRR